MTYLYLVAYVLLVSIVTTAAAVAPKPPSKGNRRA